MDKRSATNEVSFEPYDQVFFELQNSLNVAWFLVLAPLATIILFFVTFGRVEEWPIWLQILGLILTALSCGCSNSCVNDIMVDDATRECNHVDVPVDSREIARQTKLRYIDGYVKATWILVGIVFTLLLTWLISLFLLGYGVLFEVVMMIILLINILIASLTLHDILRGLSRLIMMRRRLSRG